MITAPEARQKFREAIKKAFAQIVDKRKGQLETAASEIGKHRQSLEQYANGTVPRADVLLMAFIRWGLVIRIEDEAAGPGEPNRWECSMSRKSKVAPPRRPEPVQLPLFKAIDDLEDRHVDVRILRKGPAKIELGVEIGFPKPVL